MSHDELEYTQLEPLFLCVLTSDGTAIGTHTHTHTLHTIHMCGVLGFRFGSESEETVFSNHLNYLLAKIASK